MGVINQMYFACIPKEIANIDPENSTIPSKKKLLIQILYFAVNPS